MQGEILTLVPDQRLVCRYFDKMMEVEVDMKVMPAGTGSRVTHLITITPKTFMAKMFSPLIRLGLPKQTITAMDALKRILEDT